MARKRIGEILVQAGVLDDAGLRSALNEQKRWGGHIGRILVDLRFVTEEVLVRALSAQLNFPIVDLDRIEIVQDVLDLVTPEMAEENSVVPIRVEGKFLDVAMSNPTNLGIIDEIRIRTQLNVHPYLAGPYMMQRALARFYGRGTAVQLVAGRDPAMAGALVVPGENEGSLRLKPWHDSKQQFAGSHQGEQHRKPSREFRRDNRAP